MSADKIANQAPPSSGSAASHPEVEKAEVANIDTVTNDMDEPEHQVAWSTILAVFVSTHASWNASTNLTEYLTSDLPP